MARVKSSEPPEHPWWHDMFFVYKHSWGSDGTLLPSPYPDVYWTRYRCSRCKITWTEIDNEEAKDENG